MVEELLGLNKLDPRGIIEQFVHPDIRRNYVGKKFRIVHLKSEKGKKLNGKICNVINFDHVGNDARLHCVTNGPKQSHNLKMTNLIPLEAKFLDEYMQGGENFGKMSTRSWKKGWIECLGSIAVQLIERMWVTG